jgi:Tfp pilus assembly protein PilP
VKVKAVPQSPATKPSPVTVKVASVAAQKPAANAAKPALVSVQAPAKPVAVSKVEAKPVAAPKTLPVAGTQPKAAPVVAVKPVADHRSTAVTVSKSNNPVSVAKKSASPKDSPTTTTVAVQENKPATKNSAPKPITAAGRRDPFVSPVMNLSTVGSGCSSGKRCLAIDQIALRGIVKSDTGMIAVVVNAMDKAYFLRENDPVFNGYVVKITGDSIVFKEMIHDRLGKPLTRDITKSIKRPVA